MRMSLIKILAHRGPHRSHLKLDLVIFRQKNKLKPGVLLPISNKEEEFSTPSNFGLYLTHESITHKSKMTSNHKLLKSHFNSHVKTISTETNASKFI